MLKTVKSVFFVSVTTVRPPAVSAAGTAMAAAAMAAAAAARVPRQPTYTYSTTYAVQVNHHNACF